jgi:hypothetical protein
MGIKNRQSDPWPNLGEPRLTPERAAALKAFIVKDQHAFNYYLKLVTENPAQAVEQLMFQRMVRHEKAMRRMQRYLPAVQAWLDQHPEVKVKLEQGLANVHPLYREKVLVSKAMKIKGAVDFQAPGIRPSF